MASNIFGLWLSWHKIITLYALCLQLRNLVWATSKHDVYLFSNCSLMHWSSVSHNLSEVLNFSGHVIPAEVLDKCIVFPFICFKVLSPPPSLGFLTHGVAFVLQYLLLIVHKFLFLGHVETCRKLARRSITNSGQHIGSEGPFYSSRGVPRRTHL